MRPNPSVHRVHDHRCEHCGSVLVSILFEAADCYWFVVACTSVCDAPPEGWA